MTRPYLLLPADTALVPDWVRAGNWDWIAHTAVIGSTSPEGYAIRAATDGIAYGVSERRFDLDLLATSGNAQHAEQDQAYLDLLAVEAWSESSVALLHPQHFGAATLLVPVRRFTVDMLLEALHRFALLVGVPEPATCIARVPLSH